MIGVILAISSALTSAIENSLINHKNNISSMNLSFYRMLIVSIITLIALIVRGPVIKSMLFYPYVFASGVVFSVLGILYIKAIQLSGIAKTIPFMSITPIFMIFTGYVFLGEIPNPISAIGIFIIVIGAYVLNISKYKEGLLEPFKYLVKEKGSKIMLFTAIMFSLNGVLYKLSIINSDPLTTIAIESPIVVFFIFIMIIIRKKNINSLVKDFKPNFKFYISLGIISLIGELLFATSVAILFISYAAAIKRTMILFSIILGYLIFKEKNIAQSFVGSAIMVLGVAIISIFG